MRRRAVAAVCSVASLALLLAAAPAAFGGPLSLVSATGGVQAADSSVTTAVADDGSEVAYITSADNLDPLDKNEAPDVYVWSQDTGASVRVSIGGQTGGGEAAHGVADCRGCVAISPDGRFVAFVARDAGFDSASDNGLFQVWLRDRKQGTTTLVSADDEGRPGAGGDSGAVVEQSTQLALTPDGSSVVFTSMAGNLGGGEGLSAVYVRDVAAGKTSLVSTDANGAPADGSSAGGSISADGSLVVFSSLAPIAEGSETRQVYVHDRGRGTTSIVSGLPTGEAVVPGNGSSEQPVIDAGGRFVAFLSRATNLVPDVNDANGSELDVVVHDLQTHESSFADVTGEGGQGSANATAPSISRDGRFVAFVSGAALVGGDTNGAADVFVRDRSQNSLVRASEGSAGEQPGGPSDAPSIDGSGRFVSFVSEATFEGDSNPYQTDAFLKDLGAVTPPGEDKADLQLSVDCGLCAVELGDQITFELQVANDGTIPAEEVSLASSISASGITYSVDSVETTHGTCTEGGASCALGTIVPGSAEVVTIRATPKAAEKLPATIHLDARVSSPTAEANPDDNSGSVDAVVNGRATAVDVALTVSPTAQEAGAKEIAVADIPLTAVPNAPSSTASAPLASIPLASIPLASIPLASIPLASIPLASIGWPAAALDAVGGVALSSVPLDPVRHPGGWEAQLAGTALETSLLNSTTLADVIRLAPDALNSGAGKQAVLLSDLTITSSPLASIPLASIALGPVLLSQVPIAGRTGADALTDWCNALAAAGFACTSPAALANETVGSIGLKGAPLASIPLASIPLASIPLASIPLASIPLASITITGSPLASIPLASIPLASIKVGSTPLASIPLASITISGSPLASIPLASIPLASIGNVVNCAAYDCATKTLGQAVADGAIRPGAALGDLGTALDALTLGELGSMPPFSQITLDQLVPFLPPDFTLGDLLALLAGPPAVRGYGRLPFADMPTQDFATSPSSVGYTLSFRIEGGPAETGATATVTLPPRFRYAKGSSTLEGATTTKIGDPFVSGQELTFFLTGLVPGQAYTLSFEAHPGLLLGPSGPATATVEPGFVGPSGLRTAGVPAARTVQRAAAAAVSSGSVNVGDTWEPNGESPQTVKKDTVYLSYITSANDIDAYSLPAPAAGSRVTISMVPPAGADYDVSVFRPARLSLRSSPLASIPLDSEAVVDNGVRVTHASESLEPETLADIPLASIPLASISADRGSAEETATFIVRPKDAGQAFRIQVSGYQNSTSDRPYTLLVSVQAPPNIDCAPSPINTAGQASLRALPAPASTPAGLNTVFVVDGKRLAAEYGAGPAGDVAAALDELGARSDLGVVGTTLDVSSDASVALAETPWDEKPCRPERANAVAREISEVIERYRAVRSSLEYIVLVGGDEQIPFFRVDDLATVSNESDYASTFLDKGAQYFGALLSSTVLSDNPYGTVDPTPFLDRELYVPSLAVGRLVETPTDILAALGQFKSSNGSLDPQTALVTGYDFLTDGSEEVAATQTAQHGAANVNSIVNETWTSTQLDTALGTNPPGVLSVNAHYDHHRLLPADQNALHTESQLFETSDLAGRNLNGRFWFTMGCHAGFSTTDVLVGGPSDGRALDWAQATAAGGGLLAANTGFGYGDTVAIAYSEKLMSLLAKRLDGTLTAGEALMFAKNDFRGSLGPLDVYDEKVIHEATFYGLPMYHVGPVKPLPDPPAPRPTNIDAQTGLPTASVAVTPTFTRRSGRFGDYFIATDTQVTNYRPVQPSTALDVTEPGLVARGALITQLASNDVTPFDAAWSTPTTDRTALSPETNYRTAFFPAKIPTIQTAWEPSGRRQRLVLVVGQYGKDPTGTARQRLYTSVGAQVFYAPESNGNFRHARYGLVQGAQIGPNAAFSVHVAVPGGGADVRRVVVGYLDGGVWKFVDLVRSEGDATLWTGGGPNGTPNADFFVQAVTSDGTVDVTSFKGRNYRAAPPPEPPAGVTVTFDATPGPNGWFTRSPVNATVSGEGVRVGLDGAPPTAPAGPIAISGDGIHTLTIRTPSGDGSVVVPIDTTAPRVTVSTPTAGASFQVGEVATVDFTCADAGSGITSCTGTQPNGAGLDTAAPGPHTFTVTARDAAGLETPVTRTYQVGALPFTGFFEPIRNPPALNVVKAGSAVPVKFSLGGDRGLAIFAAGYPRTQDEVCTTRALLDRVEQTKTPGKSSLEYDAASKQYTYVWKTPTSWRSGTCRQLQVKLVDGTLHVADFKAK